ncbi:MAG TPA: hypothetical protein PLV83_05725, partial [Bacilli bacterium]|nr:hypothetical protein [Bacilli bacterium]
NNGAVYINTDDYNSLFNKENYQSSVFVDNIKNIDSLITKLQDSGYDTIAAKDVIVNYDFLAALHIFKTIVTIVLIVVLFFISYFVIRIILKSRNTYFSTIRMLGATKNISKQLLIIELIVVSNLAYISFITLLYLNYIKLFSVEFMTTITTYLELKDYILLYVILILMSYLVSLKFAKKLFKNSAVSTLKEEV